MPLNGCHTGCIHLQLCIYDMNATYICIYIHAFFCYHYRRLLLLLLLWLSSLSSWILLLLFGWAGAEGRGNKERLCCFLCLASQRERIFLNFRGSRLNEMHLCPFVPFEGLGWGGTRLDFSWRNDETLLRVHHVMFWHTDVIHIYTDGKQHACPETKNPLNSQDRSSFLMDYVQKRATHREYNISNGIQYI